MDAKVQVDAEGRIQKVIVEGVPDSAQDFAACTRVVLHDMAVPGWVLNLRPNEQSSSTSRQTVPSGNAFANPLIIVGVAVLLGEAAIEAGAYTILLAVSVELVHTAVKDVKAMCLDYYVACVASDFYRRMGRGAGDSRCNLCRDVCVDNKGEWPLKVGSGRCVD
jgi:hypothetical protein